VQGVDLGRLAAEPLHRAVDPIFGLLELARLTVGVDDVQVGRLDPLAVGSAYMADLKDQFDGLYEAIAASYNGGEDNAARWLNRSKPKDPGVFVAEVGFAETKNYVLKVMNNYRVYRQLYTEDLVRR
jgi:soluble lytic murein transglycosylase